MNYWEIGIMGMKYFAGALALVACLAPAIGQATTTILSKVGNWEAFGGTTTNGRSVCGISFDTPEQYFGVKLFQGDAHFTIQMSRKIWKIENKAEQPLTLQYDNFSPWRATGTGMHFSDGDAGIEFAVKQAENDEFFREFGSTQRLYIRFGNSGLTDWSLSLAGVSAVRNAYQKCVRDLK
jgi:hypothetical protein